MKSVKYSIIATFFLILSCSNLGEQSQNDLKWSRGGNAYVSVLDEVLKKDKELASLIDKVNDRSSYRGDIISSIKGEYIAEGPETFISNFYSVLPRQIEILADSLERGALTDLYLSYEAEFLAKIAAKIDLSSQLIQVETKLDQQIQKLKINKTLAYMKEYQDSKNYENEELIKELEEAKALLNAAFEIE